MSELPESHSSPSAGSAGYDERYLAGIVCFNRGEYFDAHEVWEDLWMDCPSADRRFFQSLIQAAVSLYHWGNGNRAGADRLFHSGKRYMEPFSPRYHGLDVATFWADVERALSDFLPVGERVARRCEPGESSLVQSPIPRGERGEKSHRPTIALESPTEVHHE